MNSFAAQVSAAPNNIELIRYSGVSVMRTPHIHNGYELYFCPESIVQRCVICGTSYEFSHPAVIISKPYTIHSMSSHLECPTDYERYVFYFNDGIQKEAPELSRFVSGESMGELFVLDEQCAAYLKSLIDTSTSYDTPLSDSELSLFLSFFLRRLYALTPSDKIISVGAADFYISEALRFIVEHLCEPISAESIAKRFSVSASKLERDFKSAIGISSHEFLTACRVGEAKRLLRDGKKTVIEVSQSLGFTSETYFYRFLKKHTGKSPSEIRIKNKPDIDGGVLWER
ncbi:MAG: helix-turn-helix transcriptional regulator [Clostridia bacterium]|nr:helix-turn-helix transcriptional regulator [Clostridia bacterium]